MIRMVSIIQNPSGLTLFSKVFDNFCEKINEESSTELIGSFLSALKIFSHEFGQDEIRQIEMSTLKLLVYEKKEIMIFFLLDNEDNVSIYKKLMIVCLNVFIKTFSKDIKGRFHEVYIFQDFNPILSEILKISPNKIENSCLNCPMGQKRECLFNQVQNKITEFKKIHKKNIGQFKPILSKEV